MCNSTFKYILIGLLSTLLLSGCITTLSSPSPLPEREPFQVTGDINKVATQEILKNVIKDSYEKDPFIWTYVVPAGRSTSSASVNGLTVSYTGGISTNFIYEFKVNDLNQIMIYNRSRYLHGDAVGDDAYCFMCRDDGFTKHLESRIPWIEEETQRRAEIYIKNTQRYERIIAHELPHIKSKTKMEVDDPIGLLPENIVDSIRPHSITFSYPEVLGVEYSTSIKDFFPINTVARLNNCSQSGCTRGKYRIQLSNVYFQGNYAQVPLLIQSSVESLSYDLRPTIENFEDSTLSVSVDFDNRRLSIENKSNNFVSIGDISLYVDNEIDIISSNTRLPPNTVNTMRLSANNTRHLNQLVKRVASRKDSRYDLMGSFGIAIDYQSDNREQTLYSIKNYTYSG